MAQEPLIGIGQAFGGHMAHKKAYWIIPDVKSMVTQSKSFCDTLSVLDANLIWASDPVLFQAL